MVVALHLVGEMGIVVGGRRLSVRSGSRDDYCGGGRVVSVTGVGDATGRTSANRLWALLRESLPSDHLHSPPQAMRSSLATHTMPMQASSAGRRELMQ